MFVAPPSFGTILRHRQVVERVAEVGRLIVVGIRDRLAELLDRLVDRRRFAELDEHRIALRADDVRGVAARL